MGFHLPGHPFKLVKKGIGWVGDHPWEAAALAAGGVFGGAELGLFGDALGGGAGAAAAGASMDPALLGGATSLAGGGAGAAGAGLTLGDFASGMDPSLLGGSTSLADAGSAAGGAAGSMDPSFLGGNTSLANSATGASGSLGGNLSASDMVKLGSTAASMGMSLPQLLSVLGPAAIGALGYSATGKATEQTLAGLTKAGDQATALSDKNQALWAPYAAAGPQGISGMQKYASGAGTLGSGRGVTLGSMARGR